MDLPHGPGKARRLLPPVTEQERFAAVVGRAASRAAGLDPERFLYQGGEGPRPDSAERLDNLPGVTSDLAKLAVGAAARAVLGIGTYLAAQYRRLAARRGGRRAAVAVAHTILVIIYHLLGEDSDYHDLGANYFDERDRQAIIRRSVRRIERLGYKMTLAAA